MGQPTTPHLLGHMRYPFSHGLRVPRAVHSSLQVHVVLESLILGLLQRI